MKPVIRRVLLLFILLIICKSVNSQELTNDSSIKHSLLDSLKRIGRVYDKHHQSPEISLSKDQAIWYLQKKTGIKNWNDPDNGLRLALERLVYEASHSRYDSVAQFLVKYPFDSLNIPWDKFFIWEPLKLKVPEVSAPGLNIQADTDNISVGDQKDSISIKQPGQVTQPSFHVVNSLKDTTILVVIDTLNEVTSSMNGFPFRYMAYPYQSDSIKAAVRSLMDYIVTRDSSVIIFTGTGKRYTSLWMNSNSDRMVRFWLKNEFADSVTVWIGDLSRDTIGLFLEKGVTFRRPIKQAGYSDAYVNVSKPDRSKLLDIREIEVRKQLWKFRSEASFLLSQAALSNWVKGGDNSIATSMDLMGYADYKNKTKKLSSNNFIRLNLGFLKSGNDKVKKNLDLLETNSKLNHKAFGKFDFSAIMLFKTQIADGNKYLNSSTGRDSAVLVSKFLNPATLTIGFGLDYKPNKKTSINFSPLSYKATFVTDTSLIDQTLYGVPKDKKALHEPGASFMISNEFKPLKTITIINRLQLFTNYIHNPQNIDVDWEMIATANLNWFTDVRFNTHLIFDDDTKTPVFDDSGEQVLRPDGSPKKTARIQFKEMIGFSLIFRF